MNSGMKMRRSLSAWLAAGLLVFTPVCLRAASAAKTIAPPAKSADDLFARPQVFQLAIKIPVIALDELKDEPKEYVRATVREGRTVYENVGVRVRGGKKFDTLEEAPSLVLKFNEFLDEGQFHGHSRFFLGNSDDDPSFMKKALAGQVFSAVNVPAPRINFARVTVNGTNLGLYLIEEAVNKEFLDRYFTDHSGMLYEGDKTDVDEKLDKDSGKSDKQQTDRKALADATRETDAGQRFQRLAALLDVDRFAAFAAAEVFTAREKGYCLARNNYRIYHDPTSDKMVFIPHDLDDIFGNPQAPLEPEWIGLVARALFDTQEGRQRYLDQMDRLLNTAIDPQKLVIQTKLLALQIRPRLAGNVPLTREFDKTVAQLRESITERTRFLREELEKAPRMPAQE